MVKKHPRESAGYRLLVSLFRVNSLLSKASGEFLRPFGLTPSQFNVLIVLKYTAPDGASQVELCRHLLVNRADVTGLVRRMMGRGWLTRRPDRHDDRCKRVSLSGQGRALLEKIEPAYYRKVAEVMGVFNERETRQTAPLLERLSATLQETHP